MSDEKRDIQIGVEENGRCISKQPYILSLAVDIMNQIWKAYTPNKLL